MPVMNQSIMNTTLSFQNAIRPANMSPMDFYADPLTLTSKDLVKLCGSFGTVALAAAIIGVVLAIIALVWFGKYREDIMTKMQLTPKLMANADKVLLMLIALCFAFIIAKLLYGG